MKKKLILIIPLCVLSLLILMSIMLPHWLQGSGTSITVVNESNEVDMESNTGEMDIDLTSDEKVKLVEPNIYDQQILGNETQIEEFINIKKNTLVNKNLKQQVIEDEMRVEENKEIKNSTEDIVEIPIQDSIAEPSEDVEENVLAIPVELPTENQETSTWIDEQLQAYEGQIDEVDIDTAIGIMNKLDIDYLNGLAADGLTGEEKTLVKAHLNQRLSGGEYATALALYKEYIGLIQ